MSQTAAPLKSPVTDGGNVIGDLDRFKTGAVRKCSESDRGEIFWKENGLQRGASLKSTMPNNSNIVGEKECFQITAVLESTVFDSDERVWEVEFSDFG